MCSMIHRSGDENDRLPTYSELVTLVGLLVMKNNKLEEKVDGLQKWVEKSRKKVNVLDWLNSNVKPSMTFLQFLQSIVLNENHITYLNENNMIKTMTHIFEEYFKPENGLPIYAFAEKQNVFYLFDEERGVWSEMTKDNIISIMYYIDRQVQMEITKWYDANSEKIKHVDKWGQMFNKLVGKANALSYRDDATLGKLKGVMFQLLKCEVKKYVELQIHF
jgi:uncharacterized protein YeeX (DUF496 family)